MKGVVSITDRFVAPLKRHDHDNCDENDGRIQEESGYQVVVIKLINLEIREYHVG